MEVANSSPATEIMRDPLYTMLARLAPNRQRMASARLCFRNAYRVWELQVYAL